MDSLKFKRHAKRDLRARKFRSNLDFIAPFPLEKCKAHLAGMREPSRGSIELMLPLLGWDITVDFSYRDTGSVIFAIRQSVTFFEGEEERFWGSGFCHVRFSGILQRIDNTKIRVIGKSGWDYFDVQAFGLVILAFLSLFVKPVAAVYLLAILPFMANFSTGLLLGVGVIAVTLINGGAVPIYLIAVFLVLEISLLIWIYAVWREERYHLLEKVAHLLGEEYGKPLAAMAEYFELDQVESLQPVGSSSRLSPVPPPIPEYYDDTKPEQATPIPFCRNASLKDRDGGNLPVERVQLYCAIQDSMQRRAISRGENHLRSR